MSSTRKKQNNIALTILMVALILIISAVFSFLTIMQFGFSGNSKTQYTASQITSGVIKKMNYENLSEISPSNISKYYDIPDGTVQDCSLYISTRSDNFTEIACFKLTSESKRDTLTNIINNHIAEKFKTYQTSGDNTYSIINSRKTDIIYPYVFVAVTSDSEAAINAFEKLLSDVSA